MSGTTSTNQHIPMTGVLLLIVVCFLWGGNMVTIKVSNQGVPPILAATVRSILASVLLWAYAKARGDKVFLERRDLKHGAAIGFLFGMDFLFFYFGPVYTDASRAIIFIYTYPLWVALGAHFFLPDDRLTRTKGVGLILALVGLISVFGSRSATLGPLYWLGDLMEIAAAVFWAATTIYIKRFVWNRPISHFQTLFAQLLFSIPVLGAAFLLIEWGKPVVLTSPVLAALAYQTFVVAFFSYLLWFWMIHRFPVSRLTTFTFLAPLFGVILSRLVLGESTSLYLWVGLAMVAAGIYLVNRPEARIEERPCG